MSGTRGLESVARLALVTLVLAGTAAGQSSDLLVQAMPVGLKPLGIAFVGVWPPFSNLVGPGTAVVANSGEDSVSVLSFTLDSTLKYPWAVTTSTIRGIPSPYAVTSCGGWMVTSPSTNSVSFLDTGKGTVIATVKVGSQPYSAGDCLVSNSGDSSLSVIDNSRAVTKTIPNVPGAKGARGIACSSNLGTSLCFVAGTEADVVTVVDMNAAKAIASLPVRRPTSFDFSDNNRWYALRVASAADNTITEIDVRTLQVTNVIRTVPTPQDFTQTSFGYVATTGSGNSLFDINSGKAIMTIPGAAGLAPGYGLADWTQLPRTGYSSSFLLVTSPDSNSVYFIQHALPPPSAPSQVAVANAASFGQAAPGSLASLFASTGVSQNLFAGSLPIPTSLGGVSLNIGGSLNYDSASTKWTYSSTGSVKAPLFFVGPNQINLQVPPGVALAGPVALQLVKLDGSALLGTATFAATAPGIFTLLMNGQGQGVVLNQDSTVNFGTNPAKRGSVIQIFATGGGDTAPALGAGEAAPVSGNPLVLTKVQPTVSIVGKNAAVLFSGMAPGFVGLWQINAQVPADVTPGNAVPLVITAAGVASNTVTIAVQ